MKHLGKHGAIGLLIVLLLALSAFGPSAALGSTDGQLAQADASKRKGGWRKCGQLRLLKGAAPVRIRTRRVTCFKAVDVLAHLFVNEGGSLCSFACEVRGFKCRSRSQKGIACWRGKGKRIRALPTRRK